MRIVTAGWLHRVIVLVAVLFSAVPLQAMARDCQESTAEWLGMESRMITLVDESGRTLSFNAKIADDGRERAAGFQHVCPRVIEKMPIVFLFGGAFSPSFHMRNVYGPLDIAFIDGDGGIDEIRRMEPYVLGARERPVYRSRIPVHAAIETHPGFFDRHGIVPGAWRLELP